MIPFLLLARYAGRLAGNMLYPWLIGARDRLCHYDKQPIWVPDRPIGDFMQDAIVAQALQKEANEIKRFLDYWHPVQGLNFLKKTLIEFSVTSNSPGLGMMLYGENRTMTRAFGDYCRSLGIYNEAVGLCCAICDAFRPSDLGMVRAEFKPKSPTRYSIASSWYFDLLRGHSGFNEKMRRLPPRYQGRALADRVSVFSAALSPDYYPLFFGLSFLGDGTLESKMYLLRFDKHRSPFYRGSTLWRFIQRMDVPEQEMHRLKDVTDRIWSGSKDKMTQIAVEVSEARAAPARVNLIYCGTPLSTIKQAIDSFGYSEVTGQSVETFERMMQTDYVKYVGIRVTPKGVSPRFKLYGQAMFQLTEPYVREDRLHTKPRMEANRTSEVRIREPEDRVPEPEVRTA
ncbi:hypothetical protein [Pendulispora albinea]|uniref:Uncharacterized protein n=1 Tax=Pendulispora albinea TaxID=2741071 RepID=A0ABZ2M3D0_9BACT